MQRGISGGVDTEGATRPTAQQLTFHSQALIQQLDSVRAGHSPDLRAQPNPTALVGAGNGLALDLLMKHRIRAG